MLQLLARLSSPLLKPGLPKQKNVEVFLVHGTKYKVSKTLQLTWFNKVTQQSVWILKTLKIVSSFERLDVLLVAEPKEGIFTADILTFHS